MNKKNVAAIVPIRHESKRIPGKNYRSFCDKPLYSYIIETLLNCNNINTVYVDTDSPIIIKNIRLNFPKVTLINRPHHLTHSITPMNEVLLNDVKTIKADFYLQTHTTNPLLESETIDTSIDYFLDNYPTFDSLFSVTRLQTRLWDNLTRPINHNSNILLRTQDLPPVYEENSCIYIFTQKILENKHNRIGERPLMFEINSLESTDIDEENDFLIAESLYKVREGL